MLLWSTAIIMVVFITIKFIADEYSALEIVSEIFSIIFAVIFFIMVIICMVNNAGLDGQIAAKDARYESLVYQYENDIYENDNDIGKRELMEDIQAWNEDLAKYQATQDDFWIGPFIPNIYDAFKPIELK